MILIQPLWLLLMPEICSTKSLLPVQAGQRQCH